MGQLHKKFQDHQIKELICRYLGREIERSYIEEILGIGKTRFFALVKKYNEDPDSFSIEYKREGPSRKISKDIEDNIMKELKIEKQLIVDPEVPLRSYNYSYIKNAETQNATVLMEKNMDPTGPCLKRQVAGPNLPMSVILIY